MTTQQADSAAVMSRLERLERQNRWMKRGAAAILVLAGAVALMGGQGRQQGKAGEPEKFVLRDEKGNERAWLGMAKDGPALRFRDESGKERLWLGVLKSTPGVVLYDELGKRRAALSTGKGVVSLISYDDSEKQRAWLVMSKDAAAFHLLGEQKGEHTGLSVESGGLAVWHHDRAGKIDGGVNILKVPGKLFHGEFVDPLFPKPK